MRPIELIALLALMAALVSAGPLWRRNARFAAAILVTGLAAVGMHLALEGHRWQLFPAYSVALALGGWLTLKTWAGRRGGALRAKRWVRIVAVSAGTLAVGTSLAASYLFPIFDLPSPTGPYAVGTVELYFADSSRSDPFAPDPGAVREVVVRAWYPADASDTSASPYVDVELLSTSFASLTGLPRFLLSHLRSIHAHSQVDAELVEGSHPVALYSHGYGIGFLEQNTALLEDLASHGYVVFSIGHLYEMLATRMPDGRVIRVSRDRLAAVAESPDIWDDWSRSADPAARERLVRVMHEASGELRRSVQIWAEDTGFVLDRLEEMAAFDPRFAGRLDLDRVGALGHSFGGATAHLLALTDERIRAGVNLDGMSFGAPLDEGVEVPFLFVESAQNLHMHAHVFRAARGPAYSLSVAGSYHMDYSDFVLWSPLPRLLGFSTSIPGPHMIEITNIHVRAFFDSYLRGEGPGIEAVAARYPESSLAVRAASVERSSIERATTKVAQ